MALAEKMKEMVGITPSYTNLERTKILEEARKQATTTWFSLILDHHVAIEAAFDAVKDASSAPARAAAQKQLEGVLMGHSIAEEAIIYPFMKIDTSAHDATHAYTEQSMAKMEMVALDQIADKMSKEYLEKLESICTAVTHHMVEEERDFFPELQSKANTAENAKMSKHYKAEFERYVS